MKVVDSAPNTLVDSVKFMKVVDQYSLLPQSIADMRAHYRQQFVNEIELYRSLPKKGQFNRQGYVQKFSLSKGIQMSLPGKNKTEDVIKHICCSDQWPVCFFDCSLGITLHEYFVYSSEPELISDYFYPQAKEAPKYEQILSE